MIEIEPVAKRYAWGSRTRLQRLFRLDSSDAGPRAAGPLAEMWFSGHAGSPSLLRPASGAPIPLDEAIRRDPDAMVGPVVSRAYGPVLPYLFKIIAARVPLSLQVHPVGFEARAGFHREQSAGVPVDAPERSFRDTLAKHEMVVALGSFAASVGFLPPDLAARALAGVNHPLAVRMARALGGGDAGDVGRDAMMPDAAIAWPESRRRLFRAFRTAVTAGPGEASGIADALHRALGRMTDRARVGLALEHALVAAEAFPGDPSVMALALMNPMRLKDGDAVFIPAGQPHAYLHGMAAEIMTNSDNVLRAGMTVKHRDIPNLLRSLDCAPAVPIDPRVGGDGGEGAAARTDGSPVSPWLTAYRPPIDAYALTYGRIGDFAGATGFDLPQRGPRVLLCLDGRLRCSDDEGARTLERGDAMFIPAGAGGLAVERLDDPSGGRRGAFLLAATPF
ncbi:mannose-6-phosphate isomerase, class I [Bifidobacterium avesanii]|uniref:mannose-6-phosphate isomerase n=1 Tax=Bifidobacterium avesanii TaxID=1798157 RepID=A0A7K3THG0_9BIFI|nr:mannose-6-phosphate isomerase, class I [Bifidobacterium avesanii]KAB8294548.1 mannose-6-phosphate isomerase [Bifidobacterium avesanii]NEG78060.1 mannose-6-phosphate isomerase, class I [Bifidobacterium avesanii]